MAVCSEYIKHEFPLIDDDLIKYVEDVLSNGADEFEDADEVYEAIGEVLHEISVEKSEKEIREICKNLLVMINPNKSVSVNGPNKVLTAPVHLASMAANFDSNDDDIKSIWVMHRDDNLKVDAKKLEKALAKLQQKQEKRSNDVVKAFVPVLNSATASQVTSKKESKLEAKGLNRTKDIHIENFDIAYGDRRRMALGLCRVTFSNKSLNHKIGTACKNCSKPQSIKKQEVTQSNCVEGGDRSKVGGVVAS